MDLEISLNMPKNLLTLNILTLNKPINKYLYSNNQKISKILIIFLKFKLILRKLMNEKYADVDIFFGLIYTLHQIKATYEQKNFNYYI